MGVNRLCLLRKGFLVVARDMVSKQAGHAFLFAFEGGVEVINFKPYGKCNINKSRKSKKR